MREIKFRAWDNTSRDIGGQRMMSWEEIDSLDNDDVITIMDVFTGKHPDMFLMQYIGLKDSKGREIYEGDIVKSVFNASVHKVEWRNDQARWSIGGFGQWEVIGNTYENPELSIKPKRKYMRKPEQEPVYDQLVKRFGTENLLDPPATTSAVSSEEPSIHVPVVLRS